MEGEEDVEVVVNVSSAGVDDDTFVDDASSQLFHGLSAEARDSFQIFGGSSDREHMDDGELFSSPEQEYPRLKNHVFVDAHVLATPVIVDVDRDGTKEGFDLELTRTISEAVGVPIIASGGVGKPSHMADGIIKGKASAVLVASIFHFGECTIAQTKNEMSLSGIPVRIL